jgi:hypothetical protein
MREDDRGRVGRRATSQGVGPQFSFLPESAEFRARVGSEMDRGQLFSPASRPVRDLFCDGSLWRWRRQSLVADGCWDLRFQAQRERKQISDNVHMRACGAPPSPSARPCRHFATLPIQACRHPDSAGPGWAIYQTSPYALSKTSPPRRPDARRASPLGSQHHPEPAHPEGVTTRKAPPPEGVASVGHHQPRGIALLKRHQPPRRLAHLDAAVVGSRSGAESELLPVLIWCQFLPVDRAGLASNPPGCLAHARRRPKGRR